MQLEENENGMYSFTSRIIAQIVKEEDEYVMNMIEEYVKNEQHKGNFVSAKIIPEGQLRHIINLGMCLYAERNHLKLNASGLFPETMYVEYLRRELDKCSKENLELKRRIRELEGGEEE